MSKARILAVDDQRYFRELIEGLLGDEGFEVQTASSGEEALHILEREDFEIIITDLVMPGVDGTELVRRIKERRPEQDVVMVTGVVDVTAAVDAMKQGATDYILKPFDRKLLVDAIEKILQRGRLRDEHTRLMEENLEFMGLMSLYERVVGLFSTMSVEPLAERLIEGLCLETRAQTGVLWIAESRGSANFKLVGARGLVRVEGEPEEVSLEEIESAWCPGLGESRSVVAALPEDAHAAEALYVPVRVEGETVGLARLGDRMGSEAFTDSDRAVAEKFCEFGGIAMGNALRFRELERRSLRDPETRAYTRAFFDDAVRNEIQKANRFAQRFSVLRIDVDTAADGARLDGNANVAWLQEVGEITRRIEGELRATDLLAADGDGDASYALYTLLPQTDALGAGILAQRIRTACADQGGSIPVPSVRVVSATYPTDGTQLEGLHRVLEARSQDAQKSLLVSRPEFAGRSALDPTLDRMLELGQIEDAAIEGQILRFVLEDVVRRPDDRGLLFVSPGARCLPDVLDTLHEIRGHTTRAEIVMLAEGEETDSSPQMTWVAKSSLDSRRPFLVYFGDGPAFAMIGAVEQTAGRSPVFQTADRALVEHLAFQLQHELGILISV